MPKLNLQNDLAVQVACFLIKGMTVREDPQAYQKIIDCGNAYRERYAGVNISEVEGVGNARRLFRALKIEPTRNRPASEALLRRALKEKGFFSVNNAVDVANWCSLDFLLPVCAYDAGKIVGEVSLREGLPDENYSGINRRTVNLAGRYALVDESGPFGSPITDSLRTAIGTATVQGWFILFAPDDYDPSLLRQQAETMRDRLIQFCGGTPGELTNKG